MARSFTGTDKIDCGSPAVLDDLAPGPLSLCGWLYLTSATNCDIVAKTDTSVTNGWNLVVTSSARIAYGEVRATTKRRRHSNDNDLSLNTCTFFGLTVANSLLATDIHIYKGEGLTALAELSYAVSADGVGSYVSDAAENFAIGNRAAGNSPFSGRLAEIRIWNSIKTLTELEDVRWRSGYSGGAKGNWPILGVSPEPDLSGNGNHGTVTGTTVVGHAPIGRYVPYRVKMPHGGVLFSSLYVESHDPTKARLKWTDNSAGVKAPTVYRSTDDITFTAIATLGTGVVTYENTGLTAKTRYYYRVGYE